MMIVLLFCTVFVVLAYKEPSLKLVSAEMPEKLEVLAHDSENEGGPSRTAKIYEETWKQERTIKIVIFACAFIISGVLWRRFSKYSEKRSARRHQNIHKRLGS